MKLRPMRILTPILLLILGICVSIQPKAVGEPLPAPGDPKSIEFLKQNGRYDSLLEAFEATRKEQAYEMPVGEGFEQTAKLTADDGAVADFLGTSVAISGDTAIVGSPQDDVGANGDQGSAYIFVRSGTTWIQQQKLTASDGAAMDIFGYSVAIFGDTAIVGAPPSDVGTNTEQGSAYIFVHSGTTWSQQQKLTAADGAAGDIFGSSVAISGDTVIVGATFDTVGANTGQGSAYIFVRSGTTWSQQQKLTASDGAANDEFGDVAISGDTAIVGSIFDDVGANANQGSAYIFVRSGTTWSEQQKLTSADGAVGDRFGFLPAISGETAIVGAPTDDVGVNANQGSAYVFVRSGTTWSEQQKLTAADGAASAQFGFSSAISGETAIIGANVDDVGANGNQGSAYVFLRSGTTWSQQQKLTASDGAEFDNFGTHVAISGETAIVGSPFHSVGAIAVQGSAYVFVDGSVTPTPTPTPSPTPTPTPSPSPTPTPTPMPTPTPAPTSTPTPTPCVTTIVTNTNDSGCGSLRQAVANATPDSTINFDATVFATTQTITLTSGQLVIDKDLTIQGPGAHLLSISGNHASRVFRINIGVKAALDGLTIKDGMPFDDPEGFGGCGIRNLGVLTVSNISITGNGIFGADCYGAGIFNDASATLDLSESTISGNAANDLNGNSAGGGIANNGNMTITGSTVSYNHSDYGAGILNSGTMTVTNSTISRNTANFLGGGGTGIHNWGRLTISNSTIANNTVDYEFSVAAGIACESASSVSLRNTIVANNTNGDILCSGTVETASHNLIGDAASSGGIQNGVNGNIVGVNALLGPLQNNGGPTRTHALLSGSPAINAGDHCVLTENGCGFTHPALTADQRGMPRNGGVDIGAFEQQPGDPSFRTTFDYDGDGRSDFSVFRPSDSTWHLAYSGDGTYHVRQLGAAGDKIAPADYDGDGSTDTAVYRPSEGKWYLFRSESSTLDSVQFGLDGDIPLPADYDGDGNADFALWRPSDGRWHIAMSKDGAYHVIWWGLPGDKPVPADFDGDGRSELAVWRPSEGRWYVQNLADGGFGTLDWGLPGDMPLAGDFSGDGRADFAVYRPSDQTWHRLHTDDFSIAARQWGLKGDIPTPGDYDGDGRLDLAVYRPSEGRWYVLTYDGVIRGQQFGLNGDTPTESAYIY